MSADNSQLPGAHSGGVSNVAFGPITREQNVRSMLNDNDVFDKLHVDDKVKLVVYNDKKRDAIVPTAEQKKKSYIWHHCLHILPKLEEHTKRTVFCKLCYEKSGALTYLSYTRSNSVLGHMTKVHSAVHVEGTAGSKMGKFCAVDTKKYASVLAEKRKAEADGDEKKTHKVQKRLDQIYLKLRPKNSGIENPEHVDFVLVKWLVTSGRPAKLTKDDGFREFVEHLSPTYQVPCEDTIARKEEELVIYVNHFLRSSLDRARKFFTIDGEAIPFLSVQFDGWTSSSNKSVLGE